jgi:hypothetical protein
MSEWNPHEFVPLTQWCHEVLRRIGVGSYDFDVLTERMVRAGLAERQMRWYSATANWPSDHVRVPHNVTLEQVLDAARAWDADKRLRE